MQSWGGGWNTHMIQDFLDDLRVLDGGDDFDLPAAFWANRDVDAKDPLEKPCPGNSFCGRSRWFIDFTLGLGQGQSWCHGLLRDDLFSVFVMRAQHAVESGEVNPGSWHQGG